MPLQIRRGSDATRKTTTLAEGEIAFTTDKKAVFIGDGTTVGGLPITFGTVYSEPTSAVTAAATTALDCSLSNNFLIALGANITTLSFTNVPVSGRLFYLSLVLTQDATGGRTITWPASVKWQGAAAPTLTSAANKIDVITLMTFNGGTSWLGFIAGQNF